MSEIIKAFNGLTPSDFKRDLSITIEWDELLPHLIKIIKLREHETIDGVIASDEGLKIIMSKKRIRKSKKS